MSKRSYTLPSTLKRGQDALDSFAAVPGGATGVFPSDVTAKDFSVCYVWGSLDPLWGNAKYLHISFHAIAAFRHTLNVKGKKLNVLQPVKKCSSRGRSVAPKCPLTHTVRPNSFSNGDIDCGDPDFLGIADYSVMCDPNHAFDYYDC